MTDDDPVPPDGDHDAAGHHHPRVSWHSWDTDVFERAVATETPILLSLVVPWSADCTEMDRTTFSEPRIIANIEDAFIPVRVNGDRQPRIRDRYTMGGFPSTVFLTPGGRILAGATYLGPQGFRGILERVRDTWDERGEAAGSVPRALRDGTPPSGEVGSHIEEQMVEQLLAAYDEEFGGWGSDQKFPMPRTIEFALIRARDQALRTLEAIQTHLLDTYDGGFYRFARHRNWQQVVREKLTEENAGLIRAFSHAYRYTGEESYRESAEAGIDYLTSTLWTGEAFGASQGGDESYFRLEPTDREAASPPAVDETVFADRNGLVIDALLQYSAYVDDERAVRYASRARDMICAELIDDGRVTHFRTDSDIGPSGMLIDQSRVLTGLTTAWEVLGEPGPAKSVADWTLEELLDEDGLCDGPAGDVGLLTEPLYPLDTAVECAGALIDLAMLTGTDRYLSAARTVLESFAGASDRMGVEVADIATVSARLIHPSTIQVGAPAGSDLHRAALRLADHETVVVPDAHDQHPVDAGVARFVVDGTLIGQADTPETLESLLTNE